MSQSTPLFDRSDRQTNRKALQFRDLSQSSFPLYQKPRYYWRNFHLPKQPYIYYRWHIRVHKHSTSLSDKPLYFLSLPTFFWFENTSNHLVYSPVEKQIHQLKHMKYYILPPTLQMSGHHHCTGLFQIVNKLPHFAFPIDQTRDPKLVEESQTK